MESFTFGGEIVWRPPDSLVAQSRLKHFMDRHGIATAAELHQKSIANPEWFWNAVLEARRTGRLLRREPLLWIGVALSLTPPAVSFVRMMSGRPP